MVNVDLSKVTTRELHNELSRRAGVREIVIEPEDFLDVYKNGEYLREISGPARLIIREY